MKPETAEIGVVLPEGVHTGRDARMAEVRALPDAAAVTAYLIAARSVILARCRREGPSPTERIPCGLALARELSDLMDAVIARMFTLACERAETDPDRLPIAIVATGGYGRRELCPFSDIDITFIPHRDGDPSIDRVIRAMFTLLMDVITTRAGLDVGYAYRLMEDCATLDHQTQCGLLDARLVTGSDRVFIQFEDAFWMGFNATEFLFEKLAEREKALLKWGSSPRSVEPQLKEGPGGLRDIQTAVWLVQAREHMVAARVRGERGIAALDNVHVVPAEVARLGVAKERLFRARSALHVVVGSEQDQLVVTRQEEVAALLGYGAGGGPAGVGGGQAPAVERLMSDLYTDMGFVRRVVAQVMHRTANSRLILGIGLDCKRREIVSANDALESEDPTWLLWAFELAQKYRLALGDGIKSSAASLVETQPILPNAETAGQVFTRILAKVGSVYPVLQDMSDLGILGWFLPEFDRILNLIPYDPSHDHTVGQHSLYVVRALEALLVDAPDEDQMDMARLLGELTHPEQVVLAALLHDSGKAYPGRPHDQVSEEIATAVCARLGWDEEATDNVRFLTRQHLLMAEISRLRDLNLDETIRDFTRIVTDQERLNMLYLLTYADTRAVGEGVWTQVKGRFLNELWRRASAVLSEEEPIGYDGATIARARRRLLKDLSPENVPEEEIEEHVQAMPPTYLLNRSLQQIALHINFIRQVRSDQPVIDFHDERGATYTELTVCTYDDPQPGLLAKIAGVLYDAELDVHGAQVLTRVTERDTIALDTLWVDYRGRQLTPGKRKTIVNNLTAVLRGEAISGNGRAKTLRIKSGPEYRERSRLEILAVRNDLADELTVVETAGSDVRSALFLVSKAFAALGWSIQSARVSPWSGAARASFYIAGARGRSESDVRAALEERLRP